jgi:hypothetical protein
VPADLDARYRPHLEAHLEPGEALEGICACSQQKGLFSGGAVALGVTDRRLLVQPLDRRGDPDGGVASLDPGDIAEAKAEGAGGGWAEVGSALMDRHAVKLTLKTTGGEKLRLMFMRAEGGGLMARLGGGEAQRAGVEALAAWFARAERQRQSRVD